MKTAFLDRLEQVVLQNLNNQQFGAAELASEIAISRFQLFRILKKEVNKGINQFIREIRLEEAMKLMQKEELTASEVAYKIGFSSPSYFNKCFSDHYGFPPGEVKKLKLEGKLDVQLVNGEKTEIDSQGEIDPIVPASRRIFGRKMVGWTLFLFLVFSFSIYLLFWQGVFKVSQKPQVNDNSIAVLPLRNDSYDPDNEYFCNGMTEEIITNLQKIRNIRVKSRSSAESYRNLDKDITQIARELEVDYILEGSVRKVQDDLRIYVHLIDGKTGTDLWADSYDGDNENIFNFQQDIALQVADALNVVITPEENKKLATPPTIDVTAYDYVLRAWHEQWKYWRFSDTLAEQNAESLYDKAIKIDPDYARGWIGKASIYYDLHHPSVEYYEENYMDSTLWYIEKADQIDPGSSASSVFKAMVYHHRGHRGDIKRAIHHYEKAIKNDSGDNIQKFRAMWRLGFIFLYNKDYQKGISLIRRAHQVAKELQQENRASFDWLSLAYLWMGDYEKAEHYLNQSKDLGYWVITECYFYYYLGNFKAVLDCGEKCNPNQSEDRCLYLIANTYFQLGDFENAVEYYRKFREIREAWGRIQWDNLYREGIALTELGRKEEGMKLIERQLNQLERRKQLGRTDGYDYHLAAIAAYRGESEKAVQYLRDYMNKVLYPANDIIPINFIQYDIVFKNLWNDPDFKAIIKQDQEEKAVGRAKVQEMEERGDIDL